MDDAAAQDAFACFGVVKYQGLAGRDGALGAAALAAKGGTLIAQDRASSAVWGMPRAVAEAGLADAVLPPALIAAELGVRTAAAPRVSATWP